MVGVKGRFHNNMPTLDELSFFLLRQTHHGCSLAQKILAIGGKVNVRFFTLKRPEWFTKVLGQ